MAETIIYARVSTDEQAKRGFSIPSQLEQCRAYCQRYGYAVSVELTDDESGAMLGRDGITRMRDLVRAGAVDRIVVWRQDRLARDELSYFTLRNEFKRHEVEVHAVNRGGKVDGLYASLEAVLDADEKERIRDRTMRGRKDKALRGKLIGHGSPPYGYQRAGEAEDIRWDIDPVTGPIVQTIFEWHARDLLSPAEIAQRLTAQAAPTPSQHRASAAATRTHALGQWNRETVRWILRNQTYAGTFYAYRTAQPLGDEPNHRPALKVRPRADWIPITVPAIVDQALFDAAQHRLDAAPQLAFRNTKREYLIGRRVRCACGRAATGATSSLSGRNTKRYAYYSCNSRRRSKEQPAPDCDVPPFRADYADDVVWTWIRQELLVRDRLHKHIAKRDAEQAKRAKAVDPATTRAARLEKLRQQRDRLNRAYVGGDMSYEEYSPAKRDLDREIGSVEALPAATAAYAPLSVQVIESMIDRISGKVDQADFSLRRFIVDHLDIHVTLCLIDDKKYLKIRADALNLETVLPLIV